MGKGKNKSKSKGKAKRGRPPKGVQQSQAKKQPQKDPAVQDRENIVEYLAQLKGRTQEGQIRGICVVEVGVSNQGNRIRWVGNVPPGEVALPLLTLQRIFVDIALNPPRPPQTLDPEEVLQKAREKDEAEGKAKSEEEVAEDDEDENDEGEEDDEGDDDEDEEDEEDDDEDE